MKLFKNRNKDKEIEAEASAKSAENVNVTEAADTVKTQDRKSTRLNSSHIEESRMPSSA